MPDAVSQLNNVGNITKALLDALDQIESAVSQGLVGPDGKPSGSAIYMHMMNGISIDPKDYANPWTPMEGSVAGQFGNDGKFSGSSASGAFGSGGAAPGGFGSSGAAPGAFGSTSAAPASTSVQAQNEFAENAAFNTSTLVDQMLVVTEKGVAVSWPDRNVSIEYFGVITSAQPLPIPPPSPDVQAEVAAAQRFLFVRTPTAISSATRRSTRTIRITRPPGRRRSPIRRRPTRRRWPIRLRARCGRKPE
jgi:hypothetical protein